MTAQDPDRLTLADVARLPDYVQRAIARTIDPTLPAEPEPMTQYDADRAALARAYRDADAEAEAIYRREARRARDYDDGIIADDDH